ncbi:hypothetical protein F5880DRAFT_1511352 [Lentinula raphanica]|nr:hypothetical protein F5880DRAFT_1511352 [Lentinula raphanica]
MDTQNEFPYGIRSNRNRARNHDDRSGEPYTDKSAATDPGPQSPSLTMSNADIKDGWFNSVGRTQNIQVHDAHDTIDIRLNVHRGDIYHYTLIDYKTAIVVCISHASHDLLFTSLRRAVTEGGIV